MALKPDDRSPKETDVAGRQEEAPVLERVQELAWAVIDEVATDDDLRLLDNLLLSDDEAIREYVNCVQLHVDLAAHFAPAGALPGNSALAFLNE
jgi:hypothetical protein